MNFLKQIKIFEDKKEMDSHNLLRTITSIEFSDKLEKTQFMQHPVIVQYNNRWQKKEIMAFTF